MILNENDTVVAITPKQLGIINRDLNSLIFIRGAYQNVLKQLSVSDSLCEKQRLILSTQDKMLALESSKFQEATKLNESLQASLKKEKKKNRNRIIGYSCFSCVVGVIVGVFIIK